MSTASVITAATVLSLASDFDQSSQPFFTGCQSPELETFSCWWNPGIYSNLSGTPAFKVLYSKSGCQEVMECPDYMTSGKNSCFFNKTYTSIWAGYCLLIEVNTERGSLRSEPLLFHILDILQPDPPILLNWTRLNGSGSIYYADVSISWAPPSSADVGSGWISLLYQIRVRSSSVPKWKMGPLVQQCSCPLYTLETGQEYEVQVRCKPPSEGTFSPFSESLHFLLPHSIPASALPAPVVFLPFAVLLLFTLLYMPCSMTRIKNVLLPPIPVPKIAGINMEMLQSGQCSNLGISSNFLDMKLPPDLSEETWEEFPGTGQQTATRSLRKLESSGRVAPQTTGLIDGSDSGCESVERVVADKTKHRCHLSLISVDTVSSQTALSCLGKGFSLGTGLEGTGEPKVLQVFESVYLKHLAASGSAWHSNVLPSLSMPKYKKVPSGKGLLLYKDRGFYTHVKNVVPESSVTELGKRSNKQGGPDTNQLYRQAVSEYFKGTPTECIPLPDHVDTSDYVTL